MQESATKLFMKLDFQTQVAVTQLPGNPAFMALIESVRLRLRDIENILATPQRNWEEDLRILGLWRGHRETLNYLLFIPQEISAQLRAQEQKAEQAELPFFGTVNDMDTAAIQEGLRNQYPERPAPAPRL